MESFGRYTLVRRVGSGGMAEVWKARATGAAGFEKIVALKLVLPGLTPSAELLDMFVAEAKLVAQLAHPNIVQVTDFGKADRARWYLAMEYVEGQDLDSFCTRAREQGVKIPLEVALYVTAECCKALGYAHARKIVHRDMSPQNVLVAYSGEVKLGDFGIAKVQSAVQRTAAGAIRGKAAYMSPEQVRGETLDGRSDLFSLGIVLHEMVTGTRMFEGNDLVVLERIAAYTPEGLMFPRAIRDVLLRALDPDREKRFRNAEAMESAVMALLGAGTIDARKALTTLMRRLFAGEYALESAAGNEETNVQKRPAEISVEVSSSYRRGVVPGGDASQPSTSTVLVAPIETSIHRRTSGVGSTLAIAVAIVSVLGALMIDWSPRPKTGLLRIHGTSVEVWVDGVRVATETPIGIQLPPGEHKLRFVNTEAAFEVQRSIRIAAGAESTLYVDVPAGKVTARNR